MKNAMLPHLLIIEDVGEDEPGWRIVHHPLCQWDAWRATSDYAADLFGPATKAGHLHFYRACYVEHEIGGAGLDCLDVHSLEGDAHLDPSVNLGPFESEWKRLRPGRYRIEGWFTPQTWAGSEPVDADGGLILLEALT